MQIVRFFMRTQPEYADNFGVEGMWDNATILGPGVKGAIIPPGLFWASSLSNSFNFPRYTTLDPVIIIFSFYMSKPSQPTFLIQAQEFSEFFTFLSFIQLNPTHSSDHAHLSAIQLQFMLYFHRPGLAAMHQTTPHTSRVYLVFQF